MKKILSILLVFVMVFTFTACSGKPSNEDVRGEQIVNDNSSTTNEDSTTEDNSSTSSNSSTPSSSSSSGSSSSPSSSGSSNETLLGNTTGLTYKSKFIGIGCTLDSGWKFYTDDEIKQLNNFAADLAGKEFEEAIKNAKIVYDMYAVGSNQMDSINVNLEKISNAQLAILNISDNYKNTFPTMKSALENMGYTNVSYIISDVKLAGKNLQSMNISSQLNDLKVYQKVICIKCDGYLAALTISTFGENNTDLIASKFFAV